MILVDPREGQGMLDLIAAQAQARFATPQLNAGDYAFEGNYEDGSLVPVGIERKHLGGFIADIRSGRYMEQVDRMADQYTICVLILEDIFRPNDQGMIEMRAKGGWGLLNLRNRNQREQGQTGFHYYAEIDNFCTSLELRRNVIVKRSYSRLETVWQIVNLFRSFQKPWAEHIGTQQGIKSQSGLITRKASLLRMWASSCPGIGWQLAGRVEKAFKSAVDFATALPSELEQITWQSKTGRKMSLGKKTSLEVYRAINEKKHSITREDGSS